MLSQRREKPPADTLLTVPQLKASKPQAHLYAICSARGEGGKQRTCYSTYNTCVQYTIKPSLCSVEGETDQWRTTTLETGQSQNDLCTQLKEGDAIMLNTTSSNLMAGPHNFMCITIVTVAFHIFSAPVSICPQFQITHSYFFPEFHA